MDEVANDNITVTRDIIANFKATGDKPTNPFTVKDLFTGDGVQFSISIQKNIIKHCQHLFPYLGIVNGSSPWRWKINIAEKVLRDDIKSYFTGLMNRIYDLPCTTLPAINLSHFGDNRIFQMMRILTSILDNDLLPPPPLPSVLVAPLVAPLVAQSVESRVDKIAMDVASLAQRFDDFEVQQDYTGTRRKKSAREDDIDLATVFDLRDDDSMSVLTEPYTGGSGRHCQL
jgi:hypothetical protein